MEQQQNTGGRPGYCAICDVTCQNPDLLQQHIQGKKHQVMVSRLENKHQRDDKTIFVTGDRQNFHRLSELALSDYFSAIGQVSRVKFFKERGFAFVEFSEKSCVDQALTVANHCIRIGSFQCSLSVRLCRHSTPQQLQKLEFANRKRQQENEEQFKMLKSTSLPQFSDELALRIESGSDLAAQLILLCSEIGLTEESLQTANHVAHRVALLVNKLAKQTVCRPALFGSKTSTLGLRSSDVDLVLLFNAETSIPAHLVKLYCVDENNKGKISGEDDEDLLDVIPPSKQQRLLSNLDHRNSLASKSVKSKVKHIAAILRCYREFSYIMHINARIPIVRCLHVPTSTQLDISVDSLLSINNSHLLKFYSLYDHRIRPLILTVRYWAKIQEICPAPLCLTSYTLTWLVLFFLQSRKPPVCPTVAELVSVARKIGEPEVILSTWNATYPLDLAKWPMTRNTESLNELFPKFFDFYANFSFAESAIILRDATTVQVQSLVAQAEASATKKPSKAEGTSKTESKQQEEAKSCAVCSEHAERCCSCGSLVKQEPIVYVKGEPALGEDDVKKCDTESKAEQTTEDSGDDDCVETTPEEQSENFRLSVMNVQDPIELTRNITGVINSRNAAIIQEVFKAAAKVFHSIGEGESHKSVLRQLFRKVELPSMEKQKPETKARTKVEVKQLPNKGKTLMVALSPNNSVVHARCLAWFRLIGAPGVTLRWLCSAVSAMGVVSLLRQVLLIEISVVENKILQEVWQVVNPKLATELGIVPLPAKSLSSGPVLMPLFVPPATSTSSKTSDSSNLQSVAESSNSKELFLKLNCTARYPTWQNREEAATAMRRKGECPTGDGKVQPIANDYGLALETQISKWIAFGDSKSGKDNQQVSFSVTMFSCPSAVNKNQDEVRFELTTETSFASASNLFSSIGSFVIKRFVDAVSAM